MPLLLESEFDFTIDEDLIIILDLNGDKSVTNDMENVLVKIVNASGLSLQQLAEKKIMYRDSMGIYDGVRPELTIEDFAGIESVSIANIVFFSLGGITDEETARYKRLALP